MARITLTVTLGNKTYTAKTPHFKSYCAWVRYVRVRQTAIKDCTTDDIDAEMELIASLFDDPAVTADAIKELPMGTLIRLHQDYEVFIAQDIPVSDAKNARSR